MEEVSNPQISVVVPMYNAASTIRKCLRQLLTQTFDAYEVIIVDDGSTDGSYETCQEIACGDSRLKVFHQENKGSGAARNMGITHARGKYVFFPDADDKTLPNALECAYKVMEEKGTDLLVFGFKTYASKSRLLSIKAFPENSYDGDYVRRNYEQFGRSNHDIMGAPWNKLYRMSIIRQFNLEFPTLRRHQDEVFITRYVAHVADVYFIPDILFVHYANGLRLRYKKFPFNYLEVATALHKFRKEIPLSWAPDSVEMKKYFSSEYYVNTLSCLELLFNPKWGLTVQERKHHMEQVSKVFFENVITTDFNHNHMRYDDEFFKHFMACDVEYLHAQIGHRLKIDAVKDFIKDGLAMVGINWRYWRMKRQAKNGQLSK